MARMLRCAASPQTITVTTQDSNNYVWAAFLAGGSANGGAPGTCTATNSTTILLNCFASNQASTYISSTVNTAAVAGSLTNSYTTSGAVSWAAGAVELRNPAASKLPSSTLLLGVGD